MALIVWRNRETLLAALQTARYEYFALTFLSYAVAIVAIAIGWHWVMWHIGGPSDFILNVKIYVYTLAARRIPGTLWYVAGRAVLYQRLGIPGRISAFASSIEIVLSIVSGIMVGAPALFFQLKLSWLNIAILVLVELIGLGLLYPPVLCRLLSIFHYHVNPSNITIPRVIAWLVAYVAMWISGGIMVCTVILALYPIKIDLFPSIISLWALAGVISHLVFLLPSNLGITEFTLSFMLSIVIPLPIAIATAILIRILTTAFDIMWSSLALFEKNEAISILTHRR
jgi:hypothetical protein